MTHERAAPPDGAYLDRDGATIAYASHGTPDGQTPLLLTHGYGASAAMWQPNLASLGAARQVITWDLVGHGLSSSPDDPARYSEAACVADLSAVLDACGAGRAVIGGLSLGGYLSLAFWLCWPERVAALLLCDTGPGFKRDDARRRWNSFAAARADALDREGLAALGDGPEVRGIRHDPAGLARAARGVLTQRDARVITSLPRITVPALVLVGAEDTAFRAAAEYMAAKIPRATHVVLPDARHAANIDQPSGFNLAVVEFLDTIP